MIVDELLKRNLKNTKTVLFRLRNDSREDNRLVPALTQLIHDTEAYLAQYGDDQAAVLPYEPISDEESKAIRNRIIRQKQEEHQRTLPARMQRMREDFQARRRAQVGNNI